MSNSSNVLITIISFPAIKLQELVALIPATVSYTLTQDTVRQDQDDASNIKLTLYEVQIDSLTNIINLVDIYASSYDYVPFRTDI